MNTSPMTVCLPLAVVSAFLLMSGCSCDPSSAGTGQPDSRLPSIDESFPRPIEVGTDDMEPVDRSLPEPDQGPLGSGGSGGSGGPGGGGAGGSGNPSDSGLGQTQLEEGQCRAKWENESGTSNAELRAWKVSIAPQAGRQRAACPTFTFREYTYANTCIGCEPDAMGICQKANCTIADSELQVDYNARCYLGVWTCEPLSTCPPDGGPWPCVVPPEDGADLCDGLDNDGNGAVDRDMQGATASSGGQWWYVKRQKRDEAIRDALGIDEDGNPTDSRKWACGDDAPDPRRIHPREFELTHPNNGGGWEDWFNYCFSVECETNHWVARYKTNRTGPPMGGAQGDEDCDGKFNESCGLCDGTSPFSEGQAIALMPKAIHPPLQSDAFCFPGGEQRLRPRIADAFIIPSEERVNPLLIRACDDSDLWISLLELDGIECTDNASGLTCRPFESKEYQDARGTCREILVKQARNAAQYTMAWRDAVQGANSVSVDVVPLRPREPVRCAKLRSDGTCGAFDELKDDGRFDFCDDDGTREQANCRAMLSRWDRPRPHSVGGQLNGPRDSDWHVFQVNDTIEVQTTFIEFEITGQECQPNLDAHITCDSGNLQLSQPHQYCVVEGGTIACPGVGVGERVQMAVSSATCNRILIHVGVSAPGQDASCDYEVTVRLPGQL